MPDGLKRLVERQMQKNDKKDTVASSKTAEIAPYAPVKENNGTRKYHNLPTERLLPNGECIKFRSKKEAAYYDSLVVMAKAGVVRKIRLEHQYLLKPAYTDGQTGERFRAVSYLADFVYEKLENGQWVEKIVDTKGKKTKEYIIKRKILAEQGKIIEEV